MADDEETNDDDPMNMLYRAGFLQGLAERLAARGGDFERDAEMLRRASRSLVCCAKFAGGPEPFDVAAKQAWESVHRHVPSRRTEIRPSILSAAQQSKGAHYIEICECRAHRIVTHRHDGETIVHEEWKER